MEIRVLRYFLTVVREGSITKASEATHPQLTISADGGRTWRETVWQRFPQDHSYQ